MYGLNIDINNPHGNPDANLLKELGVDFVRFTYHDHTDSDNLDTQMLSLFTEKIEQLMRSGIKTLLILSYDTYPNKPSYNGSDQEWAIYIDKFSYRIYQLSQHFSHLSDYVSFQIWNEPDLEPQPGYEPSLRPSIYSMMLWKACDAIFSVNKNIEIVSAGLASGQPDYWKQVYTGQPIDALCVHPYGQRPNYNWPHENWGFGYVGELINNYAHIWGGRMWISEIGLKGTDENLQAEYLKRFYNEINNFYHPPIEHVFWFCYSDNMVLPYGLIRADSTRKPSWDMYQSIS